MGAKSSEAVDFVFSKVCDGAAAAAVELEACDELIAITYTIRVSCSLLNYGETARPR